MPRGHSSRDVRFDALRGLFLIFMTVDHYPSFVRAYTFEAFGYVSAAEGFVFLSGVVSGWLYTRIRVERGARTEWQRVFGRVRQLYACHALMLLFLFLAAASDTGLEDIRWSAPLFVERPVLALTLGSVFLYQPDFLDILPMYIVFLACLPWIIRQLLDNRRWTVLSTSLGLWLLAQWGATYLFTAAFSRYVPVDLGDFELLAWQAIFVGGVVIGYGKYSGASERVPRIVKDVVLASAVVIAVIFFLLRHRLIAGGDVLGEFTWLVDKNRAGALRLLDFAAVAIVLGRKSFWPAGNPVVRMLAYLGRHSLPVFTSHVFLAYLLQGAFLRGQDSRTVTLLLLALCVGSLYFVAWLSETHALARRAPGLERAT